LEHGADGPREWRTDDAAGLRGRLPTLLRSPPKFASSSAGPQPPRRPDGALERARLLPLPKFGEQSRTSTSKAPRRAVDPLKNPTGNLSREGHLKVTPAVADMAAAGPVAAEHRRRRQGIERRPMTIADRSSAPFAACRD
jgi:hypothetical protein